MQRSRIVPGVYTPTSYYNTQAYIDIRVSHGITVSVEGTNTFGPTGSNKSAGAVIYADIRDKSLVFNGSGSLTGLGVYYGLCAYSNGNSQITFNSGNYTFNVTDQGSGSPVEGVRYNGNLTVNGGSVIFDARWTYSSGSSYDAKGINGGTFTMNGGYCKAVGYSRGSTAYALANGWKGTTYNGGCLELYAGLNSATYDCGNKLSDEWPFAETDALKNAAMEYAKYYDGTTLSDIYPTTYNNYVAANGTYYQAKSYLKISEKYTVTYTDGVEGEEIFADQVTKNLTYGAATPAFEGIPTRLGWTFKGWEPAVASTVTGDAVYEAIWEQNKYTVTYTDGVEGEEVFADQVTEDLTYGTETPAFEGTPTRLGWTFKGWEPDVAETVTEDAVYEAIWEQNKYTVTYTDGVEGEEVFADKVTSGLTYGVKTPAFGEDPKREGYTFKGWKTKVAETVTEDAVYEATWEKVVEKEEEKKEDTPQTGDNSNIQLFMTMFILSAAGLFSIILVSRKRRNN